MALRYIRGRFRPRPTKVTQNVLGVVENFDQLLAIVANTSSSVSQRVTAAGLIRSSIDQNSISSIQEIWYCVMLLLDLQNQAELRRAGWKLVISCIKHDEINAGSYSTYYHSTIDYSNVEDFDLVLEALNILTQGGRRISNASTANYRLPTVLLSWIQLLALRGQELASNPQAKDIAEQWGQSTPENFAKLLTFTANVLKFNMTAFDERDVYKMLVCMAVIMRMTTAVENIERCCSIIDTIMAFGIIPLSALTPILQVLCGITMVNESLQELGWSTINNLLKSHLGDSTVQRLCKILDSYDNDVTTNMRVASAGILVKILKKMVDSDHSEQGIPLVEVLGAFSTALDNNSFEVHIQVAKCLIELLQDKKIKPYINYDIWQSASFSPLNSVCKIGDSIMSHGRNRTARQLPGPGITDQDEATTSQTSHQLKTLSDLTGKILEIILQLLDEKDSVLPVEESLMVTTQLSLFLSDESAVGVVGVYASLHLCSPYMEGWNEKLNLLLSQFYLYPNCSNTVREKIIKLCIPAIMMPNNEQEGIDIAQKLFSKINDCASSALDALLSVYKDIAFYSSTVLLEQVTSLVIRHIPDQSEARITDDETSLKLEKIASTFVHVFLALFQTSARKASLIYSSLVQICRVTIFDERPFKIAFSLLCRLRADEELCVSVSEPAIEKDYGAALYEQQVPLVIKKNLLNKPSLVLKIKSLSENNFSGAAKYSIDPALLLGLIINVLQIGGPEAVYAQVLINATPQFSNLQFFNSCEGELVNLRNFLCRQISSVKAPKLENNDESKTSKAEIISVYIHMLTILMGYSQIFTKQDYDKLLQTLVTVMNQWDKLTANWALHCLVICCYECPMNLQRLLPQILSRLQTRITSKDSSTHILEFLQTLSLVESLTSSFNIQEFKRVFGICFTYIQHATDTLNKSKNEADISASILSQYLLCLACGTISWLFLAVDMQDRTTIVSYLIRNFVLSSKDIGHLDPINLCTYDLLCRYTFSDQPLGLTSKAAELSRYSKEGDDSAMWMVGSSILQVITNKETGKSFVVVRRPTCTLVTALKAIDGSLIATSDKLTDSFDTLNMSDHNEKFLAPFWLMMLRGLDADGQSPIPIANTPANLRAISSLDRAPVVDFHKVGIIYIGPGQSQEQEILANTCGSRSYRRFLSGLGQPVRLKGNRDIYAGGLDTENDIDGEFTIAWVGKISQITFHVITMMPNPEHDPSLSSKKRHIGNNYVNIYFDDSGNDFDFDVVKSQFNFINIVISPSCVPGKFKVRAYRKDGLANVLAAYEAKIADEKHLALFIRHLTIKASVYAKVYNQHGEYTDQWLYRLDLINKLRDRILTDIDENSAEVPLEESQEPEYMKQLLTKLDFTSQRH